MAPSSHILPEIADNLASPAANYECCYAMGCNTLLRSTMTNVSLAEGAGSTIGREAEQETVCILAQKKKNSHAPA